MKLKALRSEDFVNYKQCSMFLGFPKCSWKCGKGLCQNSRLAKSKDIDVDIEDLIDRYRINPLTSAIVCGGLEPFDSFGDLLELISEFRKEVNDPFIIYTGYYENEIKPQISVLKRFPNIIVKYGRYIPDSNTKFDEILGVTLISDNQYAEVIS